MTWTRKPPTEPGPYWMRGGRGNWAERGIIVDVEIYPHLRPLNQVVILWGTMFPRVPPDAEWAGPIPRPKEPTDAEERRAD